MAKSTAIRWDEEIIAEHDKLRGTRMKIDEPDTPFAPPLEDGAEEKDADSKTSESIDMLEVHGDDTMSTNDDSFSSAKDRSDEVQETVEAHPPLMAQLAELGEKLESVRNNKGPVGITRKLEDEKNSEADRQRKFKEKRAAHYNEFQRVKEMRAKLQDDED
uniref:Protein phosphatase inhibitor 2 n=1 Tax=Octactis speculum TaxID=3111310 RepID=A0A7S2H358_9STRA|mmetsp:Transcript_60935/g.83681  ORF Transcript_60935/g.83681 Transcript_60935/m.83681 type:complete len:161 (+) Transcript_60935:37-519(+)|eukprot:CAMPEP_0185769172 /NCGR_PEP_ID=MMETSP1174-20130828/53419_1 /TAXON_ID=35687 /ORGANISM="Dictyocha speculum, Strain CCMP1381" /LENGTH=160 /DNA_ID=CAMNT_0028454145 /DNA_START=37 /DNA_END=519 /DNA_ORIENTATION=+